MLYLKLVYQNHNLILFLCVLLKCYQKCANVPDGSLTIKVCLNVTSGGLLESKSKLPSLISIPFVLPISVVFARSFAPVPDVLVIVSVGNLE